MSSYLFINQAYRPDRVATAQCLSDLAEELVSRGHRVTVIAGDRGYDDPAERYPLRQTLGGVEVLRLPYLSLGKGGKLRRAVGFASFHARLWPALLSVARADVVVPLTSPPLVGVAACRAARLRRMKIVHWVMDLNPDEAVAAGWLREGSCAERLLSAAQRGALAPADGVVALDTDMKERLERRYGLSGARIEVIPPWDPGGLRPDPAGAERFRDEHGLNGKYVVMYSGNHSPCHPLDTLLEASRLLADDPEVVFCFVGGGSGTALVSDFKARTGAKNILQLPYQPLEGLSASLSAADLHAVVMGTSFVGIVHPSKIYGILAVGRPFVLIGPERCAMADLARTRPLGARIAPGDAPALAERIRRDRRTGALGAMSGAGGPSPDRARSLELWTRLLERTA
ncbi:MAG: hypothetical protein MOGMAGMI_00461 [Candidatus Omnitrophica bacterium]|nr:hypothetical protein [Candidatus Omnitrophota bacterium]